MPLNRIEVFIVNSKVLWQDFLSCYGNTARWHRSCSIGASSLCPLTRSALLSSRPATNLPVNRCRNRLRSQVHWNLND
uniref:Uncharacterized protein n=1 Tax=Babesia bovis TaxID=5865 RepID=S6C801_BABBO|nr:hypothetical protein [Babesia bovis]